MGSQHTMLSQSTTIHILFILVILHVVLVLSQQSLNNNSNISVIQKIDNEPAESESDSSSSLLYSFSQFNIPVNHSQAEWFTESFGTERLTTNIIYVIGPKEEYTEEKQIDILSSAQP